MNGDGFADIDACVTPVLDFEEAARHPHLMARKTFVPGVSMTQASPAPRFSGRGPLPVPGRVPPIDPPDVSAEWAEGSLAVTRDASTTSDETKLANLLEHRRSCRAYIPDQVPRMSSSEYLVPPNSRRRGATPSRGTCTSRRARRPTAFEGHYRLMYKPTRCRSRISRSRTPTRASTESVAGPVGGN